MTNCVLEDFPAHHRRASYWCWAACAEMILEWNHTPRAQRDIVRDRYGDVRNATGWPRFEVAGLDHFALACKPLSGGELELEICSGRRPIAIAAQAHMVVGFGFSSDTEWAIRVVDPAIYQGNGLQWSRWALNGYRTSQPITYYQLGSAAQPGPTKYPPDYCKDAAPAEFATGTFRDADLQSSPMDREIAEIVRLFRLDHGADGGPEGDGEWPRQPPLRVYRLNSPDRVALDKALIPFRVSDIAGGALTFRWLGTDAWVRFTAQISQFATVLFAAAQERRGSGKSTDLLEHAQGIYSWVSIDPEGRVSGEPEPLPLPGA